MEKEVKSLKRDVLPLLPSIERWGAIDGMSLRAACRAAGVKYDAACYFLRQKWRVWRTGEARKLIVVSLQARSQ